MVKTMVKNWGWDGEHNNIFIVVEMKQLLEEEKAEFEIAWASKMFTDNLCLPQR